jgi:hypothetical protein
VTGLVTTLAYAADSEDAVMKHSDGSAARQLDLLGVSPRPLEPSRSARPKPTLQILRKDIYAELARRRRRAQIAARHELDRLSE